MKFLFFLILALGSQNFTAQAIADYKYIYVPRDFADFEGNQYQLNSNLVKDLQTKNYEVIQTEPRDWPQNLRDNPCEILYANLKKTSSIFRTKATFTVKDCNEKIILENEGVSFSKDYALGFQEALKKSTAGVTLSSPKTKAVSSSVTDPIKASTSQPLAKKTPEVKNKADMKEDVSVAKQPVNSKQNSKTTAQLFLNKGIEYTKVEFANGLFVFSAANTSAPYASFTPSTKENVYHVVLNNITKTIGYKEGSNYVVDLYNSDGTFSKEYFMVK